MAQKSAPRSEPGTPADQGGPGRPVDPSGVAAWFDARIPGGWFTDLVRVEADRDEVEVTGTLDAASIPAGLSDHDLRQVVGAIVIRFREETRAERVLLAAHAEALFGRKVSWAVECGGYREMFTNVSAPVMTRLRFAERQVLDTLVDASVARSRSEALAWCVRLVGQHQGDWIEELRQAMVRVEQVRTRGPRA